MKSKGINRELQMNGNRTPEAQRAICQKWAENWYKEQLQLVKSLENIIRYGRYEQLEGVHRKLEKITGDKFTGLKNVINRLTDYELVE